MEDFSVIAVSRNQKYYYDRWRRIRNRSRKQRQAAKQKREEKKQNRALKRMEKGKN